MIYVDPCFSMDMKNYACMALKLSIPALVKAMSTTYNKINKDRSLLSVLNRARSKPHFLKHLGDKMLRGELSLIDASKVYMRMNSVYKQASIERQSLKKKSPQGANPMLTPQSYQYDMLENNLLKGSLAKSCLFNSCAWED